MKKQQKKIKKNLTKENLAKVLLVYVKEVKEFMEKFEEKLKLFPETYTSYNVRGHSSPLVEERDLLLKDKIITQMYKDLLDMIKKVTDEMSEVMKK